MQPLLDLLELKFHAIRLVILPVLMPIVLSIYLSVCLPVYLCIFLSCPDNELRMPHRSYLYLPTKACQYVLMNLNKPDFEKNVSKKYGEPPYFVLFST